MLYFSPARLLRTRAALFMFVLKLNLEKQNIAKQARQDIIKIMK